MQQYFFCVAVLLFCLRFSPVRAQCAALPPQSSPEANYEAISACLSKGKAVLTGGTFYLTQGITVPPNAIFSGLSTYASFLTTATPTTLLLSSLSKNNYMIRLQTNATVSFLQLNANNNLAGDCCTSIFIISDKNIKNTFVHDCLATNQFSPKGTGIYFLDSTAEKNIFLRVTISSCHYGVIFVAGLLRASGNRVENSVIHDVHCDSVTFAGYGELVGTKIYNNGWDCKNGNPPIPGGGPYCLNNKEGGLISGNSVSDNCGMVLDIDSCAHFTVTNNTFSNPGNTWNGQFPYCQGAPAASLIDSESFIFANNEISSNRDSNAVGKGLWGDPNHVFGDVGRPPFSDLPAEGNTVLGLIVTHRPPSEANSPSINTQVSNNKFQVSCSSSGCAGIGYFAGRGSGWTGSQWTPNLYTGNNPIGSNIGSVRCGGNWYAGSTPSCPSGAPAPCNVDDYQHPDTANWRNDPGCGQYSVHINGTLALPL